MRGHKIKARGHVVAGDSARGWIPALPASALLLMLLAPGAVVAQSTPDVQVAQDIDGADDDLSNDIQDLQGQIDAATEAEEAKRASRQRVSDLLRQADTQARAGNLARAEALLEQAGQAVQADDPLTRNRVTLARASMKIRRGDLAGATSLLNEVSGSESLTDEERSRVETLKARIASATTDAQRRAAISEITTLADQAAIQRARDEIARDPGNLGARLLLGDLLRRAGQFDEAERTAEAVATDTARDPNQANRQRALVLLGRIAVDRNDLAGARRRLDELRLSGETPDKAARIADLEDRIARQETRSAEDAAEAARRAAVAEISGLEGQQAIERARAEVARDPQNFNARLVLGDLLRRAGQFDEASAVGEALAIEPATQADPGVRQRALVLVGRTAVDRGDFSAARNVLERLRTSPETPQKGERVADLEDRIARQETRAADAAAEAARRAAVAEISALVGSEAIERARAEVARDPGNFNARLVLGDLLRRAKQFDEATAIGDALIADPATAADPGVRQRALVLIGRTAVDRDDFSAARAVLERLRTSPETPQKAERIADLDERITRQEARAAERAATEARKARERAEKERIAAENARIDAELAAIGALPPAEALERSRAFYAANPGNERVANAHARLLTRQWEWDEAEAVYMTMLGPEGSVTDATLVENNGAVFGLVDLYSRTNRLAEANDWLARLEQAYAGGIAPERAATLRQRIDNELQPDQISGSITLSVGYNSNVAAPDDDLDDDSDDLDEFLPNEGSSYLAADARFRYDRIVTPNGDKLRFQARFIGRPYLDIPDVDRITLDINGGYVHNVPGTRTEVQALVGYKSRFVESDEYRRTAYGLLNASTDFTPDLSGAGTLIFEVNDDDDPDADGVAFDGDARMRYVIADRMALTLGVDGRYEDARTDFDSNGSIGALIGLRYGFDLGSVADFYALASYNPSYKRYGGPLPSGVDAGVTREDFTQKVNFAVGREFLDVWRAEVGLTYTSRDSNVEGKSDEGTQVQFSITRAFSNR